jgi:hypothetical protein
VRAGRGQGSSHLSHPAGAGPGAGSGARALGPSDADELAHRPGPEPLWAESWYFDYAAEDGSLGGYVRLAVYPNLRMAWYWTALVGAGRPLVTVRDHDVAVPRRSSLEIRAEGLWSALNCETPHDHWSIGLEAFAVAMDDPAEAYHGERGDRTALGLDLEWEASAPVFARRDGFGSTAGRYDQPCAVYGDILVDDERLDFIGWGRREHWWGIQDWWNVASSGASGRLDDGRVFGGWSAGGYIGGSDDLEPPGPVTMETVAGPAGLPISAKLAVGPLDLAVTTIGHAPVLVEGPGGRSSRLALALCRFETPDGTGGVGWGEWLGLPPG